MILAAEIEKEAVRLVRPSLFRVRVLIVDVVSSNVIPVT